MKGPSSIQKKAKNLKRFVIQSVSEESRLHEAGLFEILPLFGRLNDTRGDFC
ncbi:hypothetical protein [Bacteroides sp.]|uniref:hypothetical protein n=1 Tax=Bacteroides sp. TaxID=29523 RepID=UPI0001D8B5BA|nr:hypothetical protein [Bacteroides sp.]EFI12794.1 hypothetical protein HMPREF0106_03222 [Bacteroides sp. D22]EXY31065.1 hypothetical protein M080_6669 [Bacteroides fragilis str. 3397 T10]